MNNFSYQQKYLKYKKKYLEIKNLVKMGGDIGTIRDITKSGNVILVRNDREDRYEIHQGKEKVEIVAFQQINEEPNIWIFITRSGSVYIYKGEIREGRITPFIH